MMKKFPADYVYKKYRRDQIMMCESMELEPADCVYFGIDHHNQYDAYNRELILIDYVSLEFGTGECSMTCNNDYDPLEEIIVGTADYANIPIPNISVMKCQFPEYEEEFVRKWTGFYLNKLLTNKMKI